ncbi:MAG: preprotein translocase subunit YajC [Rickettsiaceae bacterium]|nr:preprotein translocase subunit YajC [Rickettsiaceae bacterium]
MFINNAYADTDTITVQDTGSLPEAPQAPSSGSDMMQHIVMMALLFFVFYFLLIRPQEKKRRQLADLVSGVKKGEEVLTNSGMFGTVTKIDDSNNTVDIEVSKGVNVKILKSSITEIVSRDKGKNKEQSKDKGKAEKKGKKSKEVTKKK